MSNKEQKRDFSDVEYRFSFALTINDSENGGEDIIIVKRDFNIYNLDEESLHSLELKECVDDIVNMINRDLKSKSRVYTWCNMPMEIKTTVNGKRTIGVYHGSNPLADDMSEEFSTPISETNQTTFKFTLFDKGKPVITKIWSGDGYQFSVRNSVDLTNKKFKHENTKNVEMDFSKQVAQRASVDKPDLTSVIMRHISSTCASYQTRQGGKKLMYKQYVPEIKLEEIVIAKDHSFSYSSAKLPSVKNVTDDNGYEKQVYEVYTTKYFVGDKEYDLSGKNRYKLKK